MRRSSIVLSLALVVLSVGGCAKEGANGKDASSATGADGEATGSGTGGGMGGATGTGGAMGGATGTDAPTSGEDAAVEVAPGPGVDVIVGAGYDGIRMISIDHGQTWCQTGRDGSGNQDGPLLLREVISLQGVFVSAGWTHFYRSLNGWEWVDILAGGKPASGNWIGGIRYGNGWWVAVGGNGTAMRSSDGQAWSQVDYPGTAAVRQLAFGNGIFVAADDSGLESSVDGTNWQPYTLAEMGTGIVFVDQAFHRSPDTFDGFDVRVRFGWPSNIQVAPLGNPTVFKTTGTSLSALYRFAFATVSEADFGASRLPAELKTCLGR